MTNLYFIKTGKPDQTGPKTGKTGIPVYKKNRCVIGFEKYKTGTYRFGPRFCPKPDQTGPVTPLVFGLSVKPKTPNVIL